MVKYQALPTGKLVFYADFGLKIPKGGVCPPDQNLSYGGQLWRGNGSHSVCVNFRERYVNFGKETNGSETLQPGAVDNVGFGAANKVIYTENRDLWTPFLYPENVSYIQPNV
jgi:hypothetical protein